MENQLEVIPEEAEVAEERDEVREEVRAPLEGQDLRRYEQWVRGDYLKERVEQAHAQGRKYRDGTSMSSAQLRATLMDVQARVQRNIAPSTEATYANTMARFERFCALHLPNERMSLELRLMIWGEYQIEHENVSPNAVLQYCKNISAGIQKTGGKLNGMELYMQGLRKSGAMAPEQQAVPIAKDELYHLLRVLDEGGRSHEQVHILIMWFTASRFDDVQKLVTEKLEREKALEDGRIQWNVRFDVHKGNPFYLGGSSKMILQPDLSAVLERHLTRRSPQEPVTATNYNQVNMAIQEYYPNLSCHSIKRGALMEMLRAGVPLETLQVIAKHRQLQTLLVYLDSARVADAIGIPLAAANL